LIYPEYAKLAVWIYHAPPLISGQMIYQNAVYASKTLYTPAPPPLVPLRKFGLLFCHTSTQKRRIRLQNAVYACAAPATAAAEVRPPLLSHQHARKHIPGFPSQMGLDFS
jgi:hypothetical protein